MANRKNSHRRRVRVAVLMVLCGAVFAAFFARLAWMQFVRADYYADKAAEASSASYTGYEKENTRRKFRKLSCRNRVEIHFCRQELRYDESSTGSGRCF